MSFSVDFINERIAKTKTAIEELETLISQLTVEGGIVSYTLDTGQTRTVIQNMDVIRANKELNNLYARLSALYSRLPGGATIGVPGF